MGKNRSYFGEPQRTRTSNLLIKSLGVKKQARWVALPLS